MDKNSNPISATTALVLVLAAAAAMFAVAANAQPSPAPSPAGLDCIPYLLNVSDCLSYVEKGSNLTKPEKPCCPEVKNLLEVQPICLCELLANPDQSPIPIDIPKATALTDVCKLKFPFGTPAAACSVLGVPIGAPAPGPAPGLSPLTPAPGTTSSPEGSPSSSPTSPASPGNGVDGLIIASSQRHFLVGLALVLFVRFF